MSLTLSVQKAILDTLTSALSVDVYGTPTATAALPYVDMQVEATPTGGNDRRVERLTVNFTIWSNGPGNTQAAQIIEQMWGALDDTRLILDTGEAAWVRMVSRGGNPDLQEQVYQGRATARVIATRQ
jgi:hypothetical protein